MSTTQNTSLIKPRASIASILKVKDQNVAKFKNSKIVQSTKQINKTPNTIQRKRMITAKTSSVKNLSKKPRLNPTTRYLTPSQKEIIKNFKDRKEFLERELEYEKGKREMGELVLSSANKENEDLKEKLKEKTDELKEINFKYEKQLSTFVKRDKGFQKLLKRRIEESNELSEKSKIESEKMNILVEKKNKEILNLKTKEKEAIERYSNLEKQIFLYEQKLKEKDLEIEKENELNSQLKEKMRRISIEIDVKNNEILDLKTKQKKAAERYSNLEEKFILNEQKIRSKNYELEKENEKINQLNENIRKIKIENENLFEEEKNKRQLLIKNHNEKINYFENKILNLNQKFDNKNEENLRNKNEILELKNKNHYLIEQIEQSRENLAKKEAIINSTGIEVKNQLALVSLKQSEILEIKKLNQLLIDKNNEMNEKMIKDEIKRKKLHNLVQELKGNIRVYCRIRPKVKNDPTFNDNKARKPFDYDKDNEEKIIAIEPDKINIAGTKKVGNKWEFNFDRVFRPNDDQNVVFEEISQLVQSALDGYKVCIFAYGQTGSGKTYTMEGPERENCNEKSIGMISRSVSKIFDCIEQLKDKRWHFECKVMFLEIYNETLRDLLSTKNTKPLEIKHFTKPHQKTVVENLKYVTVKTKEEIMPLLNQAKRNRAVGSTNVNLRSSRSHSVFQISLTGHGSASETTHGELNLVDLAGSERLSKSKSQGVRLKEAQNINKSLSSLSSVITALNNKAKYVPFRDSKLTYLLKNSFGGDCKTLMFVNLSPDPSNFNESINSLRFASVVNSCYIGTARKDVRINT